jgi:large subunit ribosomal protein L32
MAHPKSRISKQRRNTRRTHYKATAPSLTVDPTTGQYHLRHHAHQHDGKVYYRGRVLIDNGASSSEETTDETNG